MLTLSRPLKKHKAIEDAKAKSPEQERTNHPFGTIGAGMEDDQGQVLSKKKNTDEDSTSPAFGISEARAEDNQDRLTIEDGDEWRLSPPYGTTEARAEDDQETIVDWDEWLSPPYDTIETRAEDSQDGSGNEDVRFIEPKSWRECEIVECALGITKVHYWNVTGEDAPPLPFFDSYMYQWKFIQGQLNFHWAISGLSGEPPSLFILDPWSGGIGDWKYEN